MRDEGIFDGDLIGVHRTRDARSGQIVVARIDDEITVKLLKIGKDRIRLLPRNPDYSPIVVSCPTRTSPSKACTAGWCGRTVEPHDVPSSATEYGIPIEQEFSDTSSAPLYRYRQSALQS